MQSACKEVQDEIVLILKEQGIADAINLHPIQLETMYQDAVFRASKRNPPISEASPAPPPGNHGVSPPPAAGRQSQSATSPPVTIASDGTILNGNDLNTNSSSPSKMGNTVKPDPAADPAADPNAGVKTVKGVPAGKVGDPIPNSAGDNVGPASNSGTGISGQGLQGLTNNFGSLFLKQGNTVQQGVAGSGIFNPFATNNVNGVINNIPFNYNNTSQSNFNNIINPSNAFNNFHNGFNPNANFNYPFNNNFNQNNNSQLVNYNVPQMGTGSNQWQAGSGYCNQGYGSASQSSQYLSVANNNMPLYVNGIPVQNQGLPVHNNNMPLPPNQPRVPLHNQQLNAPIQNQQLNVPIQNQQLNVPIQNQQQNVPIQNQQQNVPIHYQQHGNGPINSGVGFVNNNVNNTYAGLSDPNMSPDSLDIRDKYFELLEGWKINELANKSIEKCHDLESDKLPINCDFIALDT
ncbi:unnamed protein product [Rotaria socialis]|nr:unnamed protein product [Rotaria socialis]